MDERKLSELFNAAVPDAPPPSFDDRDIAAASNRQRARQRALLGGSALGVAILAGVSALAMALWTTAGTESGTAANAGAPAPAVAGPTGNAGAAPNEVPQEDASHQSASDKSFPVETSKQGDESAGNAGPSGPCEKADPELAAALAGELRAADSFLTATELPATVLCPAGGRAAAARVSGGVVSVVVWPRDSRLSTPLSRSAAGAREGMAPTASGGTVLMVSEPDPGSSGAPLADRLDAIARRLATKY
ncbi:MAG TPA: hypothetical protein VFV67_25675 [Actinophytocola sp.]|uniref:hypothetical protein n=1 Tax=Actinophytocola sp. TaxID=1872138 RepID=UPI002DB5D93A|nr:hypothetical protein [Actinophytocola sp.]HEU5474049.1 hypothetical protein [Actinophytocola sp.]